MSDPTPTTATETPTTSAVTTTVKPGRTTSEHALSVLAIIVSALFVSGAIPTDTIWAKVLGVIAAVLISLGYTVSRTIVKTAVILCLVSFGLRTTTGCSWTKSEAKTVETAAVDCTKGELGTAVKVFSPVLEQLIVLATGGDGHVDTAQLASGTKTLAGDIGGCVLTNAVAKSLKPKPATSGSPQSSPLVIDPGELRAFYEAKREQLGGKTYVTEQGPL